MTQKKTEYDFKPMSNEEIDELTKYTFWELFGEAVVSYGSWVMVILLAFLFAYSIIMEY